MSIGDNIKRLREESGMSQAQLAIKSEISQPFLAQVERGTKALTLNTAENIAAALNVSILDLMRSR